MEAVKGDTNRMKRPGGFTITGRAISVSDLQPGARILDVGCGSGATVEFLKQNFFFDPIGIDLKLQNQQEGLLIATAENIPFPDVSFDGVIMECSLSLIVDQSKVLTECRRVLKENGWLIVSDMYARGSEAKLSATTGKIDSKETLISLIKNNGFAIKHFEDFTHELQSWWGQMIMDQGAEAFYCALGAGPEEMKKIKCGYCLIIAIKTKDF